MKDFTKKQLSEKDLEGLLLEHVLQEPTAISDEVWENAATKVFANDYKVLPSKKQEERILQNNQLSATWKWLLNGLLLLLMGISFYVDFQITHTSTKLTNGSIVKSHELVFENNKEDILRNPSNEPNDLSQKIEAKNQVDLANKSNSTRSVEGVYSIESKEQKITNGNNKNETGTDRIVQDQGQEKLVGDRDIKTTSEMLSRSDNDLTKKKESKEKVDFNKEKTQFELGGHLTGVERAERRQDLSNYEGEYYSNTYGLIQIKQKKNELQITYGKRKLSIKSVGPEGRAGATNYKTNSGLSTFFQFQYDKDENVKGVEVTEITSSGKKEFNKVME